LSGTSAVAALAAGNESELFASRITSFAGVRRSASASSPTEGFIVRPPSTITPAPSSPKSFASPSPVTTATTATGESATATGTERDPGTPAI
jgi:hypothetical protein